MGSTGAHYGGGGGGGFDRLDDEQLMSMFCDDIGSVSLPPSSATASTNPSTPSDERDSNNEEKGMVIDEEVFVRHDFSLQKELKNEPREVESACDDESDTLPPPPPPSSIVGGCGEHVVDPKRVKR